MRPETEGQLAQLIRESNAPLRIAGGDTRTEGTGAALSTAALTGITLYEPGALTMVAQAGTPVAEIEARLATENQRLAFEPPDWRALLGREGEPTIGGVFATNASGPRRMAVGAARDFALGVRFVTGAGEVVKNGGRVMKNVTGYDLVKLLCGSRGTLGVLTEVSFKVLPEVECTATLVLEGLDDAAAVAAMSAALGSPYEVTGAAHLPAEGRTYLRLEGFEGSVDYRAEALTKALAAHGSARRIDADPWRDIRDATRFGGRAGDVWRISVKPSDAPAMAARLGAEEVFYDWGGGLIWALSDGGDLRARMDAPGHATLMRGGGDLPRLHPEPAPVAALSEGIRAKFDPKGLFRGVTG